MEVPAAKIAVPHIPARYVRRPRLLAMLDGAAPGQLITVNAPAGYGKTLLLAEWAARRPERTAWVSLDDDDGTEHRLLSAVLAALTGCAAVPADNALHRLAPPSRTGDAPEFVAGLVAALDTLPEPLLLVLDDVHELIEPGPIKALAELVRARPSTVQLALAGRADPPLPIARLRLAGDVCDVRAHHLAFSPTEAAALLAGADVTVLPEQVLLLVDRTAGWAAGLRLAALSLREAPDPDRFLAEFAGSSKALSDYLVGEILSRLSPATCDLLRAVCVCDQLTADLAAELSGRPDAGDVLAALEHDTSLVLSAGVGRVWYRIHPLLRSHLRADVQRRRPELVTQLHLRSAGWFADRGHAAPALLHARLARDPAVVAALTTRFSAALMGDGQHDALREALQFLSGHREYDDPHIALVAALIAIETGSAADTQPHLARAARHWPPLPSPDLVALLATVKLRSAITVGAPDGVARAAAELDAEGTGAEPDVAALGRLEIAFARALAGRPDEGLRLAADGLSEARRGRRPYLAARALVTLATLSGMTGDYRAMREFGNSAEAELALGRWADTGTAAILAVVRAYGAWLDAEPGRCLHHLGRDAGDDPLEPVRLALRAAALTETGRGDECAADLRGLLAILVIRPLPTQLVGVVALLVHGAATVVGRPDVTADVERMARISPDWPPEVALLLAARAAGSGQGDAHAAVAALLSGLPTSPTVPWVTIEAHVLACGVALHAGRRPQARRELHRALSAAAAMDTPRALVGASDAVVELLARQIGSFGPEDDMADRVLRLRGRLMPGPSAEAASMLTAREREVLGRLGTPASLDDIAAQLSVAPSTVKTHVRAVYAKLGVNNRRDAVALDRQHALSARHT